LRLEGDDISLRGPEQDRASSTENLTVGIKGGGGRSQENRARELALATGGEKSLRQQANKSSRPNIRPEAGTPPHRKMRAITRIGQVEENARKKKVGGDKKKTNDVVGAVYRIRHGQKDKGSLEVTRGAGEKREGLIHPLSNEKKLPSRGLSLPGERNTSQSREKKVSYLPQEPGKKASEKE